jgi:hypothetical protein
VKVARSSASFPSFIPGSQNRILKAVDILGLTVDSGAVDLQYP